MFKKLFVKALAAVMTVCLTVSLTACVNFTSYEAHKHTYAGWEVTAPTETEKGFAKGVCSSCEEWEVGHVLAVELPVLSDKAYKTFIRSAPSCDRTGVTQYVYSYAGKSIGFEVVTDKLAHAYEWVQEVPATETEAGEKAHYVCTSCGKLFDKEYNEVNKSDLVIECTPAFVADESAYYLVGNFDNQAHWSPYTDDLKLSGIDGYLGAIKNVTLKAGDQIKVVKGSCTEWYSCAATEDVNTVITEGADGIGNGVIIADGSYDVYLKNSGTVYIVKHGAFIADDNAYYLVGNFDNQAHWSPYTDDLKLSGIDGYLGAIMNVALKAGDQIKVVKGNCDVWYSCVATENVNTVITEGADGIGNGVIIADGDYNIYLSKSGTVSIAKVATASAGTSFNYVVDAVDDQTLNAAGGCKLADNVYVFGGYDNDKALVTIDNNSKKYGEGDDQLSFTKRLKLGGAMNADKRYVRVDVTGACKIIVYCMSSSSSAERIMEVYKDTPIEDSAKVTTISAINGSALQAFEISVSAAGSYYFGSTSGGINIYGISVVYS